jgi:hypothetical protein
MKRIRLPLAAAMALSLTACGGNNQNEAPARVNYSTSAPNAQVIQNYTDADWLYQNYLGSYGLPSEVKPRIMPAIQMLANGFALQFKRGDDVSANIAHFHSQFINFLASDQATQFLQSLAANSSEPLAQAGSNDFVEAGKDFVPPEMTQEEQQAVNEAKVRDEELRADVLRIAAEYGLPYKIEGQDAQWFIYTPTMKGGKGGGGGNQSAPKKHPDITRWDWRMGDLIWVNGELGTGIPGHIGLMDRRLSSMGITDANTPGVAHNPDVNGWASKYTEVRAHTPRLNFSWDEYNCYNNYRAHCRPDSYMRVNAVLYANAQIGKPYNWNFFNPGDTTKFYCSSLVWQGYRSVGYNLLAPYIVNNGVIMPSDLVNSRTTYLFNSSKI